MTTEGLRQVDALRIAGDVRTTHADRVIEETPIALLYNGSPFAVMMATPTDLDDFALGFALSEGVIATPNEFKLVDIVHHDDGIALHAAIPQARFDALGTRSRNLAGHSGCGLCGTESLQAAIRPLSPVRSTPHFPADMIREGLRLLSERQPLNAASGGVHAAGYVHAGGIVVREDVGRHNALDKVVGAVAKQPPGDGFLAITSRASYEIVHKAATSGIGMVVAISAPTALAIRLADAAGVTLVAFARGDTMNVYSHAARVA